MAKEAKPTEVGDRRLLTSADISEEGSTNKAVVIRSDARSTGSRFTAFLTWGSAATPQALCSRPLRGLRQSKPSPN